MVSNAVDFEQLDRQIRKPPFHQWLGLRLAALDEDGIEIALPWRPELVVNTVRGYTHGGILATLVDIAADCAVMAKLGRGVPTVDMRVDYHRVALQGELRAKARILKLGRTFASAEASIYNAAGELCASGRGVFYVAEAATPA
jgi:uncharacterized protein (TIGR00369 family)